MTLMMMADIARTGIAAAVISVGLLMMSVSAVGLLRFPDFFARLHVAPSMSLGALLVLAGLLIMAPSLEIAVRFGLLILLINALTPILPHLLASGGLAAGISPMVGGGSAHRAGGE